jgi:phosphohistidine phosphatase SixA
MKKSTLAIGIIIGLLGGGALVHVFQSAWRAEAGNAPSVAGDVNADGKLNLTDPVFLLNYLFLGGPAPSPCAPPAPQPVSTVVMVRHAEREPGGCNALLTPEGEARAQNLARILGPAPVTHLVGSECIRTRLTLEPLAQSRTPPLPIESIASEPDVAARLRSLPAGSLAVVAHHSFTIHEILQALGVSGGEGIDFASEYDNFLVILRPADGAPQLIHMKY